MNQTTIDSEVYAIVRARESHPQFGRPESHFPLDVDAGVALPDIDPEIPDGCDLVALYRTTTETLVVDVAPAMAVTP